MKLVTASTEIISKLDGTEILKTVELAGRTCYKSEDCITEESSKKFIQMLIDRGHEAMIEHFNITAKFICDRGVSHEIVRHRLASYAQESTRYCNYSKDKFNGEIAVIDIASGFNYDLSNENDIAKLAIWETAMDACERAYLDLIKIGASAQEARSVLPTSLKTEIIMTANLREWRHFFRLRTDKVAHPQMQEVAIQLLKQMKALVPVVFDDLEVI